jgi:hypothetical protein
MASSVPGLRSILIERMVGNSFSQAVFRAADFLAKVWQW